jgi:hypothetical protein
MSAMCASTRSAGDSQFFDKTPPEPICTRSPALQPCLQTGSKKSWCGLRRSSSLAWSSKPSALRVTSSFGEGPFVERMVIRLHDYYGDSVAIGLASRRRSRILSTLNVSSATVGAPFAPLSGVIPHRSIGQEVSTATWKPSYADDPDLRRCVRDGPLHRWELGFRQSSFRHIARVLRDTVLNAFRLFPL